MLVEKRFLVNTYNLCQHLMIFCQSRLTDELTGTIGTLQILCGSWVMLPIVLKRKFFIKQPLSQDVPYITLFLKMNTCVVNTDVQKH